MGSWRCFNPVERRACHRYLLNRPYGRVGSQWRDVEAIVLQSVAVEQTPDVWHDARAPIGASRGARLQLLRPRTGVVSFALGAKIGSYGSRL